MFSLSTFHSLSPPGCRYPLGARAGRALRSLRPPDPDPARTPVPAAQPRRRRGPGPSPLRSLSLGSGAPPPPRSHSLRLHRASPASVTPGPAGMLSRARPGLLTWQGWRPWADPLRGRMRARCGHTLPARRVPVALASFSGRQTWPIGPGRERVEIKPGALREGTGVGRTLGLWV